MWVQYAEYKSFEWIAQAMAGAMSMTGWPDGPPTKAIGGPGDTGAGLHTPLGIPAAIIHCASVEMWKTLTTIVGRPELGDDPRYADRRDRVQFIDEIDAMIEAWTEERTKHEVQEILAGAGVPCGAVLDSTEVLADPHLRASGMIVPLEHPRRGPYPMPANPVRLSDSPTEVVRAPLLGEHNAEVYSRLLGYGAAELDALRRDGVI